MTLCAGEGIWRSIGSSLLECTSQREITHEPEKGGGSEVLKESPSPTFHPSSYVSEVFSRNDDFSRRKRLQGR